MLTIACRDEAERPGLEPLPSLRRCARRRRLRPMEPSGSPVQHVELLFACAPPQSYNWPGVEVFSVA